VRFLPVNSNSFLVELASLEQTLALHAALEVAPLSGVEETIPAARTLLIRFTPGETTASALAQIIGRLSLNASRGPQGPEVIIPVRYRGEDLPEAAELLGLSVQQLIARHSDHEWQVAFTGFAPGFAYMVSDAGFNVPRRTTPRTRIPAGSVALAGEFSGIYPQASPGGWQLIGDTPLSMWDLGREPPALLTPGARVRFVDESRQGATVTVATEIAPPETEASSAPQALEILASGLQALYQDEGRAGQARLGISPSGALDRGALRRANRLVGNPWGSAVIEITQGGLRARALSPQVVAVTGAPCPVEIRSADGQRFQAAVEQPLALEAGEEIRLGAPASGVRSYLALRGGFAVAPVLHSCAFDTLAQVGPPPLLPGDRLHHAGLPCQAVEQTETAPVTLPMKGDVVTLDFIPGPRSDWFTARSQARLTDQLWQVTDRSNRIGLRLAGAQPLERSITQELPSEGVCSGAIQIPASGQPVLFLNDRPLTGGYPVIGAVADYHLDLAGQIPPGATIRFRAIAPFQEPEGNHD
jgi:KipI family sensor histidine kinase inhibitor